MHSILTPFFLVALTSQTFAKHPSDHESLLPTTDRSSHQSDKSIVDVDLLRRSSRTNSSTIPLAITLTAPPTTHLTLVQVPHVLIPISSSPSTFHQKRDDSSITRRITCPSGSFTISSDCNKRRTKDSRTWRRYCFPNGPLPPGVPYETEYGYCAEEEICLDGVARDGGKHYAICVNLAGLIPRNDSAIRGEQGEGEGEATKTIQSAIEVGNGRYFAAQIFMMEDDGSFTAVVAQSLSLNALIAGNAPQGGLWQRPKAVSQRCSNCTQVGLASVPPTAARLSANVRLQDHVESARLYVVAVEV
ncbi:MAG: hypothetical protein Q9195_002022 [Heterodermia aff. obscurata]